MKVLTRALVEQKPKPRRRRSDETRTALRGAAISIFRRAAKLPAIAYAAFSMCDALDWMNPLQVYEADINEVDEVSHYTENNHLSPHP
jgi:hypothetical protein